MKFLSKVKILFLLLAMAFTVVSCSNSADEAEPSKKKKGTDFTKIPLTLEFIADGEITITCPWSTLKYVKNDGDFTAVKGNGDPVTAKISVQKDDKVSFYAVTSETKDTTMYINCSSDCYIYGNIMTLISLNPKTNDWDPTAKTITKEYFF